MLKEFLNARNDFSLTTTELMGNKKCLQQLELPNVSKNWNKKSQSWAQKRDEIQKVDNQIVHKLQTKSERRE